MSGQPALVMNNGIKQYFTFILAVIISAGYILFLVIQQLEETLKEIEARVDNPVKIKGKENDTSHVYLN
ncbi:MAG TPA: hypothetical protein VFC05_04475 [Nitrososphaeraceae archaeon]|nr:hypothetical protein [Nitrososphaeraceae archaeon]